MKVKIVSRLLFHLFPDVYFIDDQDSDHRGAQRKNANAKSGIVALADAPISGGMAARVYQRSLSKGGQECGCWGEVLGNKTSFIPFAAEAVISGVILAFCNNPSVTAFTDMTADSCAAIRVAPFRLLPAVIPCPRIGDSMAITSDPNTTIPKSEAYFNSSDRTLDWRGATIGAGL